MSKDIILAIPGYGLGDSIAVSTIPERLVKEFGHRVSISPSVWGWTNSDVKMLWERNPYVTEVFDIACPHKWTRFEPKVYISTRTFLSWVQALENAHGLEPINLYPKIYWEPKVLPELKDKIFIETTSNTQAYTKNQIEKYVYEVGRQIGFNSKDVIVIKSKYQGRSGKNVLVKNETYNINGIDDLADVINSCKIMLTMDSGAQSLASAIKQDKPNPLLFSLFTTKKFNNWTFTYPNVLYKVIREGLFSDWMYYVQTIIPVLPYAANK